MKKLFAIILSVIITLSVFAGCRLSTNGEQSALQGDDAAPEELLITVPDLIGMTLDDAREIIERSGLRVGDITYADIYIDISEPADTIMEQNPSLGEIVIEGAEVDLIVASGVNVFVYTNAPYTNEKAGFAIDFPAEWTERVVIQEVEDGAHFYNRANYEAGGLGSWPPGAFLSVGVLTHEQWAGYEYLAESGLRGHMITENDNYVYVYSTPTIGGLQWDENNEDLTRDYQEMAGVINLEWLKERITVW